MSDTKQSAPANINAIALHYIQKDFIETGTGFCTTTYLQNGTTIQEYSGSHYLAANAVLPSDPNQPLFRLFTRNSKDSVAVFPVASDNQEDTELTYLGTLLTEFKNLVKNPKNHLVVSHLVIPLAERNYFFNWPFPFWQRNHYVTLYVDLSTSPPAATLYDPKGSMSGYYRTSAIQTALYKALSYVRIAYDYKNHQGLLNATDDVPWCITYAAELALKGRVDDDVQIDYQKQRQCLDVHFSKPVPVASLKLAVSEVTPGYDEPEPDVDEKAALSSATATPPAAPKPGFFARHKAVVIVTSLFLFLAAAAAIATLVYFTAPVSLPIIAILTAKVGLSLSALQALPPLAVAAAAGSIGALVLAAATAVTGGIVAAICGLAKSSKPAVVASSAPPVSPESGTSSYAATMSPVFDKDKRSPDAHSSATLSSAVASTGHASVAPHPEMYEVGGEDFIVMDPEDDVFSITY